VTGRVGGCQVEFTLIWLSLIHLYRRLSLPHTHTHTTPHTHTHTRSSHTHTHTPHTHTHTHTRNPPNAKALGRWSCTELSTHKHTRIGGKKERAGQSLPASGAAGSSSSTSGPNAAEAIKFRINYVLNQTPHTHAHTLILAHTEKHTHTHAYTQIWKEEQHHQQQTIMRNERGKQRKGTETVWAEHNLIYTTWKPETFEVSV